jgi:glycosyl transferase family 25
MNSIVDIKHAYYINLHCRPDRKQHVENQLRTVGICAERFEAIQLPNGAVGCSLSHLKLLEFAKNNKLPHVLIIEDDIKFLNTSLFIQQFNLFLSNHKNFDVVLIAGNNFPPHQIIDNTCVKVSSCQTTTGYLVNEHYYDTLITNFRTGVKSLLENPLRYNEFAIDKYWFNLQQKDNWFLIVPLSVTQREDFSNIENKPTNYTSLMIDLDKKRFFQHFQTTKINNINNLNNH